MAKELISALTLDIKKDGWGSQGFIMRQIEAPMLDEKSNPQDATSVIIQLQYAGVCGSDKGIYFRQSFKDVIYDSLRREAASAKAPAGQSKTLRVLGHEFLGKVVEVGSQVSALYGISEGMLVSGDSHVTCGQCYQCRLGENNVCTNEKILGISTDGIFAKQVKIPAKNLWSVSSGIRPEIGAMFDPMGNAIHAVTKTDVRGRTVAVFGTGAIGLFSILFLRNFGASKIIAVDTNEQN